MKEIKLENSWLNDMSLYEVVFILPKKLKSEMMLLEKAISIKINEPKPKENYKYTRIVSGNQTSIDITIKFDSLIVYNMLQKWYELIWSATMYKSDIIGEIIINQHDRTGHLIRRFTLFGTQLISLDNNNEIIEANFIADYWVDDYTGVISLLKTKEAEINSGPIGYQGHEDPNGNDYVTSPLKTKEAKIELGPTGSCGNPGLVGVPLNNGYHLTNFPKGILGEISKIEEELNELKDAEKQKSKVMMMIELSDLYGAIEEYCIKNNLTMEDLKIFSDITKRAFKNGHRK